MTEKSWPAMARMVPPFSEYGLKCLWMGWPGSEWGMERAVAPGIVVVGTAEAKMRGARFDDCLSG